jgi:hypothetical protein
MSADLDYAVGMGHNQPAVVDDVESVENLRGWMQKCIETYGKNGGSFEDTTPRGRVYIAETIQYQAQRGLAQTGSAPNFFEGIWSLATCKKSMRRASSFQQLFEAPDDDGIRRPKYPVFIFACSSRNKAHDRPKGAESNRNWLASVAMVTHGFDRMEDYGRYLLETQDGSTVTKRLTHTSGRPEVAANRGDCHVDEEGQIHYPPNSHQHGESESNCSCSGQSANRAPDEHIDNSEGHIKCVAEPGYWLGWTEPKFALTADEELNVGHRNERGFDDFLGQFERVLEGDQ